MLNIGNISSNYTSKINLSSDENRTGTQRTSSSGPLDFLKKDSAPLLSESASRAKLDELINKSHKILLKVTSIFPFDFFPDTILIDENKVNILERNFLFGTGVAHSVLVEDISEVYTHSGLFFASLCIVDSSNPRFPITLKVGFLSKKNAYCARRLIQGLMAARRYWIDFSKFESWELERKLEELGKLGIDL